MKLLVPIDGSDHSKLALNTAKELGEKLGAKIVVFTVVPDFKIMENYAIGYEYGSQIEEASILTAKKILKSMEENLKDYPCNVEYVYELGDPGERIIKYAEENGVDLIIMGNRGLGAFSRTLLGSVSYKVINHSKVSVLVVKDK